MYFIFTEKKIYIYVCEFILQNKIFKGNIYINSLFLCQKINNNHIFFWMTLTVQTYY